MAGHSANKRQNYRYAGPFEARWSGLAGGNGRLTDISEGGCFVESTVMPALGELVLIATRFGARAPVLGLRGRVVYVSAPIGFGVRFDLRPEALAALRAALSGLRPSR